MHFSNKFNLINSSNFKIEITTIITLKRVLKAYHFYMEIKYFDKPGYIAWSNSKNHSELIASASIYEEEGLYALNILELDLQERAKKINVIGSGYTNTPFRCVAWDTFGEK